MTGAAAAPGATRKRPLDNPWIRIPLILVGFVIFGVAIFWPAGTLDWLRGWLYMGMLVSGIAASGLILKRLNPEVLEHRRRIGKGTKRWDRAWLPLYRLASLAILIVAGLDAVRYGWSSMSVHWWPVGLLLFAAGHALVVWAMAVNEHFEGTVRIQTDRNHRVIDTGPYRIVRHPGYLGMVATSLGSPLLLGSWWSMIPAVIVLALALLRTWLEDTTLQRELDGYASYAERVRCRLLPGLW